jgi:hypothetical protein
LEILENPLIRIPALLFPLVVSQYKMAPVEHHIDPDPDTVIVLSNPCTDFAPWEPHPIAPEQAVLDTPVHEDDVQDLYAPSGAGSTRLMSKKQKKQSMKEMRLARERARMRQAEHEAEPLDTPQASSIHQTNSAEPSAGIIDNMFDNDADALTGASSTTHNNMSAIEVAQSPADASESLEPEEEGIHYYVSSRHLMLASPMFKRMLTQDGFAESGRNEVDGMFHIEVSDWDAEAFLIILRIIHLRNRQVPRTVSLEMLAKIAVVVDYYGCEEAIELYTAMWIKEVEKLRDLPDRSFRDIALWIWVAWTFDLVDQFESATIFAMEECTESMQTIELPIPSRVSGKHSIVPFMRSL